MVGLKPQPAGPMPAARVVTWAGDGLGTGRTHQPVGAHAGNLASDTEPAVSRAGAAGDFAGRSAAGAAAATAGAGSAGGTAAAPPTARRIARVMDAPRPVMAFPVRFPAGVRHTQAHVEANINKRSGPQPRRRGNQPVSRQITRRTADEDVVRFEREIVAKGMWSAARERLTETGPETTLWVSENEYRFSGLSMRLVGLLMPGAFRKQTLQHMRDFKAFAEHGTDVRAPKG
jgi:hypothetical protein